MRTSTDTKFHTSRTATIYICMNHFSLFGHKQITLDENNGEKKLLKIKTPEKS